MDDASGLRCDLCYALLARHTYCYTYLTPCTGTEEEARRGEAFWAEDPEWGLCLTCHQAVQQFDAGDIDMLEFIKACVYRGIANNAIAGFAMNDAFRDIWLKEHAVPCIKSFLEFKTPGYVAEVV